MPDASPPPSTKVLLSGGCWPSPGQTLLLKAALLDPAAALPAWERWKSENDLEVLEAGTFRLLGLLYRNLIRAGVDPDKGWLPRLKGVYRNFWTKNQMVLGRKGGVLKALALREIPCMLLKGAALTLTIYRDHGVRPMDDFDLLVPFGRVGEAMDLLEELGWRSQVHSPRDLPASIHACSFKDSSEAAIDLHWRLCHLPAGEEFDRTMWEMREPLTLHGQPVGVPCISDQFLHTCAHGPQYKAVSPVRWIADAYFLIRESGGRIDWQRVARHAPAVGGVHGVQGTLAYLAEHLDLPVPEAASHALRGLKPSFQERWENRLLGRSLPSPLHRMPLDFSHHLRCSRGQGWWTRLRGFPVYFRHANNLVTGQFTAHYKARAAYWMRHWLPWHLRRVPRLVAPRDRGAVDRLPAGSLIGFYPLEPHGHRVFRWSQGSAGVRLPVPQGDSFKIAIDTGRLRAWTSDLSRHLQFSCNGSAVPPSGVKGKQGVLTLTVALPPVAAEPGGSNPSGRMLDLSWICNPIISAGDPRQLGLPVFSVHIQAVKVKKTPPATV